MTNSNSNTSQQIESPLLFKHNKQKKRIESLPLKRSAAPLDGSPLRIVEKILQERRSKYGKRSKTEYLVKYLDMNEIEWLPYTHVTNDIVREFKISKSSST